MRPSHASFALRVFLLCHGGWGGWVRGAEVANHVQCLLRSEVMLWYWSLFLFLPPKVMLLIFVSAGATRSDATLLLLHLPSEVMLRYWSLLLRLPSEVMLSHAIGFCFYTCPQKPCYPLPIDLCFPTCHQKWWCYAIDFYFNTCHQKWCYPIDLCFSTCTRSDSMLLILASTRPTEVMLRYWSLLLRLPPQVMLLYWFFRHLPPEVILLHWSMRGEIAETGQGDFRSVPVLCSDVSESNCWWQAKNGFGNPAVWRNCL